MRLHLSRLTTDAARTQNTLLFDNGDIIQGNPLADYVALPGNFPASTRHARSG